MMLCNAHSNSKKLNLVVIKYVKNTRLDVFIKRLDVFIKKLDVFTKMPDVFTAYLKIKINIKKIKMTKLY